MQVFWYRSSYGASGAGDQLHLVFTVVSVSIYTNYVFIVLV